MAHPLGRSTTVTRKRRQPDENEIDLGSKVEQKRIRRSARLRSSIYETACPTQQDSTIFTTSKRLKRSRKAESPSINDQAEPFAKRQRPCPLTSTPAEHDSKLSFNTTSADPSTVHWIEKKIWPKEYFDSGTMGLSRLLARQKSTPSLSRKRSCSSASLVAPSDRTAREEKNDPYSKPYYEKLLRGSHCYMAIDSCEQGIEEESIRLVQELLDLEQIVPTESAFQDDRFMETCRRVAQRNETRVMRDITMLLVPSAEVLSTAGAKELRILVESANEGWTNCIPLTKPRPQPDYAVGFTEDAFTKDQLRKLAPFIGTVSDQSYFMATYYMYFPFLACEVKCASSNLDVADWQNAHSMMVAVRGVVELFCAVSRQKEIDRQILAFSVSHDHHYVRIYGHYADIKDGHNATFHRHLIDDFSFSVHNSKRKWIPYKFTKSIYSYWMPSHFKRLCSAIDDLPFSNTSDDNFQQASGLSQDLDSQYLTASEIQDNEDNSARVTPFTTPDGSFLSQQGGANKRRGRRVNN